jgi:hypothetical protein
LYVNGKIRPNETIPGIGEDKMNDGEAKFKYEIFDIL